MLLYYSQTTGAINMSTNNTSKVRKYKSIPTNLTEFEFNEFVLPHLSYATGKRGPKPEISAYKMFNYILYVLHSGCQWKLLQCCIDKDENGVAEIHYTNVFRQFQRWCDDGSFDKLFEESVMRLQVKNMLDLSVLHGDGTTTLAKKGGDNIGFSGHKHFKGEKVVAITDRCGNVLSPYTIAPGNKNESPLFKPALKHLKKIVSKIGASIIGSIMSLDGVYDSRKNRKLIFNARMIPNIPENKRNRKKTKRGPKRKFVPAIFEERFFTVERMFSWEDKFKRALIRFEKISKHYFGIKLIAYSMINLRHFCG